MKKAAIPRAGASALARTWLRLRGRPVAASVLDDLPRIPVAAGRVATLAGPGEFRDRLLALIAGARERIVIAALYLQDDEAGREILAALHAAKFVRPALEIFVFVDWHRARRGLIGRERSPGNAALYRDWAERCGPGVAVMGVPVKTREVLGVMHLKGFVVDDTVLYSGASLNDVYLGRNGRYRLDRYHVIRDRRLADSLTGFLLRTVGESPAVSPLDGDPEATRAPLRPAVARLQHALRRARYPFSGGTVRKGEVGITPLVGIGGRGNELNAVVLELIGRASRRLVLYTPYFNLPGPVRRAVDARLKAGCQVTLVVGDKVANDFYIPPSEPFKAIGALPYLYESNLRRWCRARQRFIDAGLLDVRLWRDGGNTYHLKGLLADDEWMLLTGHNLNPRAWRMDLENGLLVHDPHHLLRAQNQAELARVLANARRVESWKSLETLEHYPAPAQRLLKRLARTAVDRLVNQVL